MQIYILKRKMYDLARLKKISGECNCDIVYFLEWQRGTQMQKAWWKPEGFLWPATELRDIWWTTSIK